MEMSNEIPMEDFVGEEYDDDLVDLIKYNRRCFFLYGE
jgi:hypothetical protein